MNSKKSLDIALQNSIESKKIPDNFTEISGQIPLFIRLSNQSYHQLSQLKVTLKRKSLRDLVVESLNDLFIKYDLPPIA